MSQLEELTNLILSFDAQQLENAITLLTTISNLPNGKFTIYSESQEIYTNIPSNCLQVVTKHKDIGPKTPFLPSSCVQILSEHIIDDYIVTHAEKYDPVNYPNCVLMKADTVRIHDVTKVVFENYVFWLEWLNSVSKLYATLDDFELLNSHQLHIAAPECEHEYGTCDCYSRWYNQTDFYKKVFYVSSKHLYKIVPVDKVNEERADYDDWVRPRNYHAESDCE